MVSHVWPRVAGHEVRRLFRRPLLHGFTIVLSALAGVATFFGLQDVLARQQDHARLLQEQVQSQLDRSLVPGWSVDVRLRGLRPPDAGAAMVRGVEVDLPGFWDFGPDGVEWGPEHRPGRAADDGLPLDLGLLVLALGGLLAGLLGTEAALAARRDGTLAAVLNLPVPVAAVAAAKLLAMACAATYAAAVMFASAAAVVVAGRPEGLAYDTGDLVARAASMIVPTALYLLFMAVVGAGVGFTVRREATAYVAQIVTWVLVAMLGPAVPALTARAIVGTPSRGAIEYARRDAYEAIERAAEFELGELVVQRSGASAGPVDLEVTLDRDAELLERRWSLRAAEARRAATELDTAWWAQYRRERRIAAWVSAAAPGLHLLRALEGLAGTGPTLARTWHETAERYHRVLTPALFDDRPRVTARIRTEGGTSVYGFPRRAGLRLADLPVFGPPALSARDRLASAWAPTLVLALYVVASVVWFWRRFARGALASHSVDIVSSSP